MKGIGKVLKCPLSSPIVCLKAVLIDIYIVSNISMMEWFICTITDTLFNK